MANLPKHFMVSDGALYDTRQEGWHSLPALRPQYAVTKCDCKGDSQAIRAAIRQAYAWPGGYELFGITSDGAALCSKCMRKEYYQIAYSVRHDYSDGWQVVGIESAGNCDGPIYCDHCNKVIVEGEEC